MADEDALLPDWLAEIITRMPEWMFRLFGELLGAASYIQDESDEEPDVEAA
jgi:hypothetical protein